MGMRLIAEAGIIERGGRDDTAEGEIVRECGVWALNQCLGPFGEEPDG